jgi:hypothetical protein
MDGVGINFDQDDSGALEIFSITPGVALIFVFSVFLKTSVSFCYLTPGAPNLPPGNSLSLALALALALLVCLSLSLSVRMCVCMCACVCACVRVCLRVLAVYMHIS